MENVRDYPDSPPAMRPRRTNKRRHYSDSDSDEIETAPWCDGPFPLHASILASQHACPDKLTDPQQSILPALQVPISDVISSQDLSIFMQNDAPPVPLNLPATSEDCNQVLAVRSLQNSTCCMHDGCPVEHPGTVLSVPVLPPAFSEMHVQDAFDLCVPHEACSRMSLEQRSAHLYNLLLPGSPPTLSASQEGFGSDIHVESDTESIYEDAADELLNDEEESDDESTETDNRETPIFEGSDCSLRECLTLLLTFFLSHHLTIHCLNDLLALLQLLLPRGNSLIHTARLFFQYFEHIRSPILKHYYCEVCYESVPNGTAVCPRCGPGHKLSFFIQMSVADQLKKLFLVPGFSNLLSYPKHRVKSDPNAFEDIYDGSVYLDAAAGFGTDSWITYLWNTDGFALFRSSNFEIWPFYLALNELPPHLRFLKENMILAGLWFGKGKFDANLFLKPIYEEFKILKQGIEVFIPERSVPHVVKSALLCGTCDSPAKSMFCNHNAFNGLHGCPKCLIRGSKSAASGNVFVYSHELNLTPRSDITYREHLNVVRERNQVYFGVKGPTYLEVMLLVSMIRSTSIDVMHAVFQGTMKSLLHMWFDDNFRNEQFSQISIKTVVSDYLRSVKPPHGFQRVPQSLDKLKFWKASEFQSFLFYYSVPILSKVMQQVLFNHFLLFHLGICLLCKDSISNADVVLAQSLLNEFSNKFQDIYGLRYMTFNLHIIRHLPDVVRELGPLWATSCFMFEDLNGCLKRMVHGTQYTAMQVKSNFELLTRLPILLSKLPDSKYTKMCSKIHSKSSRLRLTLCISRNIFVVGSLVKNMLLDDLTSQYIRHIRGNVAFFKRLKVDSCLYVANSVNSMHKNSSNIVYFSQGVKRYGIVKIFLKVSTCTCNSVCSCHSTFLTLVQRVATQNNVICIMPEVAVNHIVTVDDTNILDCIPIADISSVCVRVSVDKTYFIPLISKHHFQ